MNIIVGNKIDEINTFINGVFMPMVYLNLLPTAEQQNDEDWWSDTFIHTAVNSDDYDFADEWFQRDDQPHYIDTSWDAFVIVEMINKINKWYADVFGEQWAYASPLTLERIYKMYAYFFVNDKGVEYWIEQKDRLNEYVVSQQVDEASDMSVVSDEDAESVEEEYNGSKDFPSNETDDNCPICLEAYTEENPKDGIRCSDIPSNCSHYCCERCWYVIWGQHNDTNNCPICKRNITEWLSTHYPNQAIKDFLKTLPPPK